MNTDFETQMDALLTHLEINTQGFKTISRRAKHWDEVSAQPALFLRRIGTTDEPGPGDFLITTLECEIWLYSNAGKDPKAFPDVELSRLDKQVRDALTPDFGFGENRLTLDGAAYWCRIEGRSDYSPGEQGGQAISRIPVRITLP